MHKTNTRIIPSGSFKKWTLSRRKFIRSTLIIGVASQTSFISSCLSDNMDYSPLTKTEFKILRAIQEVLFPSDSYGPGALDFNADKYVLWVLNDKRIDPDENKYVIDGITWVEEAAIENYKTGVLSLSEDKMQALIDTIASESWGESWLSVMMTLIFEAMISDPVYGFNDMEQGWKWLDHIAGFPRPDNKTRYDQIFNTVKNN